MKKYQIYTRKRHEALASSLKKYIKLQKAVDNFCGVICGAVGLAESFLLISAYTKLGEAASVFFLYVFMIIDIALDGSPLPLQNENIPEDSFLLP